MDSEGHVCPDCGQPVESVVRRYKTLGAWVPRWVAGPCHNPDCEARADALAGQPRERESGQGRGKEVKPEVQEP